MIFFAKDKFTKNTPRPAQETGVWRLFAVNPANTVSFKVPPQFTTVWLHLLSFYTCSDSQKRFVIFDVGLQLSVQTVVLYISVDGARRKENGKWVWLCWEGWRKGRTFVELSRCIYFLTLSRPSATKCDFIWLPWRIDDHPGKIWHFDLEAHKADYNTIEITKFYKLFGILCHDHSGSYTGLKQYCLVITLL